MKDHEFILLVEDDLTLADLTKEMLGAFGIKLEVARTLEKAVEIYSASNDHIPLVILDMNLDNNTGIEVFEKLKKIDDQFVSVLASGMITSMEIKKYKDMGFDEIVQKPYSFKSLLEIINKHC